MTTRIAINGFGRIGRLVCREAFHRPNLFDVVAVNDLAPPQQLAQLFKYDTVHGRFDGEVNSGDDCLAINGKKVHVLKQTDPAQLPWRDLKVDVVIEATGIFRQRAQSSLQPGYDSHLTAGARKVILTAPAASGHDPDATIVMGVNDDTLLPGNRCVSNASCTTNCLAPVAQVLHRQFGISRGRMTTIHAYTNDQSLHDQPHRDPYRGRAASANIVPAETGAASAIGKVIPDLDGRLDGAAFRVPVLDGSVLELTVWLDQAVEAGRVNAAFRASAATHLNGILEYTDEPLVSNDIIGNRRSAIVAGNLTKVTDQRLLRCVAWYDNEWGYSCRIADLAAKISQL